MSEHIHRHIIEFSKPLVITVAVEIKSDAVELKRLQEKLNTGSDALKQAVKDNTVQNTS